jgi:arsenate reductase-like glutaredoxin family protein
MSAPRYTLEKISRIRITIYGIANDDVFPEFIKLKEFKKFLEEKGIEYYHGYYSPRIYFADFKTTDVKKVLKWLKKNGCKSPKAV